MTTSIPDEQTIRTLGTGTNLMNGGSFGGFLDNIGPILAVALQQVHPSYR